MKKFLTLLFLGVMLPFFGQCTIEGVASTSVGEEVTLTAAGTKAQCSECHLWVAVGNSATIKGDSRLKTVKMVANVPGRQVISLAMLTPQGLSQCSKNIDVAAAKPAASGTVPVAVENPVGGVEVAPPPATPVCDIPATNFNEIKYDANTVSLFPEVEGSAFKYNWTATYNDGTTFTSSEKVPRIPYSKGKPITIVRLQMISQKCMKEFTKRYDSNFWYYF